eukprot:2491409-Pyramimonas_sp.AAC.1
MKEEGPALDASRKGSKERRNSNGSRRKGARGGSRITIGSSSSSSSTVSPPSASNSPLEPRFPHVLYLSQAKQLFGVMKPVLESYAAAQKALTA